MAVNPCLKREQLMEPERRGSKSWKCSETCVGEGREGRRGGRGGGEERRKSLKVSGIPNIRLYIATAAQQAKPIQVDVKAPLQYTK